MSLIFKKSTAQPQFDVAASISGTLEATETLTCAYTVTKARAANVTVRWYRHTADDGTDPTGVEIATGATYVLTGTDVGSYIRAIVTAINPAGTVQSTTSYTAIITSGDPPEPPALVTPAAITGTADVGETLTVTYSFTGQDSVAIQWYSYSAEPTGNPLVGTDEVLLGTASTQALTESEAGRWIGVVVTATNAVDDTQTSASVAMAGVDPYAPLPPETFSVSYSLPTSGVTRNVLATDDLQAAFNAARPGDVLVLQAGATFTGNYTFPATYADGSDWIYIISSAMADLPLEGTRVSPANATSMPKIQTPTYVDGSGNTQSECGRNGNAVIKVETGASKLWFAGLEITTPYADQNGIEYRLVSVGEAAGTAGQYCVFDRCYVHGTSTGKNKDGFVLYAGCSHVAIKECYIDDFKGVGTETHGIHIQTAPGPTQIKNNVVTAAGINVFICDSFISNASTPRDVEITGNYITKKLAWDPGDATYGGVLYVSKNLLETKGSHRVLVRGNKFENDWVQSQATGSVLLQGTNGKDIRDFDMRDNLLVNCNGMSIANPTPNGAGTGNERVRVYNNLWYDMRDSGRYHFYMADAQAPHLNRYITIDHNTILPVRTNAGGIVLFNGSVALADQVDYLLFTNNLVRQGSYGVIGNGKASGYLSASHYCATFDFNTNVVIAGPSAQYSTTYDDWRNFSRPTAENLVGFTDTAFAELADFVLLNTSAYYQAGTDGADIGCDISALQAQLNDVL